MHPEQLEQLEVKIAYQEQTIEELNQMVYQQSLQIAQLQETCRLLQQRFAALSEMLKQPDSGDEKPPHY